MAKNKQERSLKPPDCYCVKDANFFQSCTPPPPPGGEDLWELQFCRWWGWNWIKKSEENKKCAPKRQVEEKKVEKKPFKDLCSCLRFKKKSKVSTSLQKLYSTPSNSVILQETYTCGVLEKGGESISCLEVQRNFSRKGHRPNNNKNNVAQTWPKQGNCCSSCQECQDEYTLSESSDEPSRVSNDSSDYQNVCKTDGKKMSFQTQTPEKEVDTGMAQTSKHQCDLCGLCDYSQIKKKLKKKHIHLVCCHCCCCCCQNQKSHCHNNNKKQPSDDSIRQKPCNLQKVSPPQLDTKSPCHKCVATAQIANTKPHDIKNKLMHDYRPWDRILYGNKSFSKFGVPSQKYPWLQSTRSDILDKYYTMKLSDEFSSPVSGKTFNLAPVKIESVDEITISTLPDPIEVEDDIKYLNHLEKQVKMDLESRGMLDAVCDAILYDRRVPDVPNTLLNKFNYASESNDELNDYCDGYLPQREPTVRNSEADTGFASHHNMEEHSQKAKPTNVGGQEEQHILLEIRDLLRQLASGNAPTNVVTNHAREASCKRTLSPIFSEPVKKMKVLNSKSSSGESLTKNVSNLFEKIDEIATRGLVNVEKIQNVINATGNKVDDSAMPAQIHPVAKDDSVCLDTSEIFQKIDEIIMRSTHNSDDIQNVLNIIPKKIRDYVNTNHASSIEENHENAYPFQLSVISESMDENSVETEEDCVKNNSSVAKKEDTKTDKKILVAKKKRKSKQSLIPVKQDRSGTIKKK